MRKSFVTLTTAILIFLMVFTIHPQVVFADEGTPTSDETAPVDETPPPEENVEATEINNGSEQTEVSDQPAEEYPPSADETIVDETETLTAPEQETSAEQTESAEETNTTTVSDILEQAPEGTQLVVLDDEGQAEPLASQEAAEIVRTGDPIWCPANVTDPQAYANGCTGSWDSFEDLLDELANNTNRYSGDGIVYIAHDYDSSLDTDVEFDANTLTTLGSLTLQGGWDFTTQNLSASNPFSTLNGISLGVVNWSGDVTINNIIISSSDFGLEVYTTDNVSISNVEVTDTTLNDGIIVEADGNVTFSGVEASSNTYNGAIIAAGGNVAVENSTFEDNGYSGAYIYSEGTVQIQNSTFSSNLAGDGLYVEAFDSITLNSVTASNNGFSGAFLISNDDVSVTNSAFNNNTGSSYAPGIEIASTGTVTLSSVIASNNSGDGIVIYDSPEVTLSNVTATNNDWDGVYVESICTNVYVVNGTYTGNGFGFQTGYGIEVETGRIYLAGTPFFSNNYSGNLFANPGTCYEISDPVDRYNEPPYYEENFNPVISIIGGETYFLACRYESVTLVTPRNNRITFEGVCDLSAIIMDLSPEDISTPQLPAGLTFVNGISVDILYDENPIDRLPSYSNMILSFIIPNGMENDEFTIYYFGNDQSINIDNFIKVDNRILTTGRYPGIYILAKK